MLVGFLSTLFFIFNVLLIILIVMQKNHGGFWSGPAGSDSVNIFGGNQGADVLQKITWGFGAILIIGCLFLSVYQASQSQISQFYLSEIKEEIINKEKNMEKPEEKSINNDEHNITESETIKNNQDEAINDISNIPLEKKESNKKENEINIKKDIPLVATEKKTKPNTKKDITKKTITNNKQKK